MKYISQTIDFTTNGVGVSSVVVEYHLSTDTQKPNTASAGWTDDFNAIWSTYTQNKDYKYIWSRDKTIYTDGTSVSSDPRIDNTASVIAGWCDENDKTLINGGNIATGSITADQIDVNSLFVSENFAVGIQANRNYFKGYTNEEIRLEDRTGDDGSASGYIAFTDCLTFNPCETIGKQYTISLWAKSPNGTATLDILNINGPFPNHFYFYPRTLTSELGNEWTHLEFTFTNGEFSEGTTDETCNRIEFRAIGQYGVLLKKIKVEEGDKASSWTPAPEDGFDNIVTSINASPEGVKIRGDKIEIEGKSFQVFVQDSINAIDIEGRNLLRDSSKEVTATTEWFTYADLAPIFDEYGLIEYTISFDIKSQDTTQQNYVQVYCHNGNDYKYSIGTPSVLVTTEYTRQFVTVTPELANVGDHGGKSMLAFFGNYNTGNIPCVKNVKVEKGNKATAWTPAPEDIVNNESTGSGCSWIMKPDKFEVKTVGDGKIGGITVDNTGLTVDGIIKAQTGGTIGGWSVGAVNSKEIDKVGIFKNDTVADSNGKTYSVGMVPYGGGGHVNIWAGASYSNQAMTPWEIYNALEQSGANTDTWSDYVPFYVTGAGQVRCSNIEATGGKIGGLKIDHGIKGYSTDNETFSLTAEGLSIKNPLASLSVGSVYMSCDQEQKTYFKANGPLYIQSGNGATSMGFMADSGDAAQVTFNTYLEIVEVGSGYMKIKAIAKNGESNVRVFAEKKYTIYYQTAQGAIIGNHSYDFADTLSEEVKILPGEYESMPKTLTIPTYGVYNTFVRLKSDNTDWLCDAKDTALQDQSFTLESNVTQKESKNNILIIGNIVPNDTTGLYTLGTSKKYWGTVFTKDGSVSVSDRNEKNTIQALTPVHTSIFDALRPVSYKFNNNESNRTHFGFIAQDVKAAVELAGLTTQDFAAYCEWNKDDGTVGCGLRYSEFIALCVDQIQCLKSRVSELETKLAATYTTIED